MTGAVASSSSPHELLYDIDGVRVVETREPPPWLQESYELFQSWPEGTPTPHYFPPRPGHLTSILHQFQAALGYQRQSHPTPPQVVTQLAKEVRIRVSNIYNTSFSVYHVVQYTESSPDRDHMEGTLYTIHLQISPKVQGHSVLVIEVFKSITDSVLLVNHYLSQ